MVQVSGRKLLVATILLQVAACSLLVGCASPRVLDCTFAKPHRFSDATVDHMTDAEVQQELTHNKQGAKLCGWKP